MSSVMRIMRLAKGRSTPFDGQYVKEYDPARDGVDGRGGVLSAYLVTTPDKNEARHFSDHAEAISLWRAVDPRQPVRPDGKPNRPLAAFTVTIESV